jgi:ribosomal protein S12 methylthiotransferase accessory factor
VEVENCVSALKGNHLDVLLIDVMHSALRIPAFYTIIPGAYFRERAVGTSVGMFSAKLVSGNENPLWALDQLEKMDRLLPDKYYIKFYKGLVHLAVQEHGKALDELGESLRLDPKEEDIPSIYSYMGVCFKELEQYRKAIEVLRKAEQHDDERTDVYNLLGFCFYKLGEHEKAIQCFQQVLKIDPSSAIDYANIASNYRDMGNREMAIHYYTLALELDDDIEFARENLQRMKTADND